MEIIRQTFNHICVNTYLLVAADGETAVIDPGCCGEEEEHRLGQLLAQRGCRVKHILLTHAHADHIQGCEWLKASFPESRLSAHPGCADDYRMANMYSGIFGFPEHEYPPIGHFLEAGERIVFGTEALKVLHTPGHARGSVCYYHETDGVLFSGDTLFSGSVGRTDLPGGSQQELYRSLREVISPLPDATRVLCGHGGDTTIGDERRYNPYFQS